MPFPIAKRARVRLACVAALPLLALASCHVAAPTGPTVVAFPGRGKSFAQFQADDANCRNYAQSRNAYAAQQAQAAGNNANGTAVAGTLIGAAAGAVLGAVGGNAGAGAAIGAGAGLAGGAAVGGGQAQDAANSLQGQYDAAYAQCMVGNGERLQPPQEAPAYYAPPPPPPPPSYYGY